MKKLLMIPIIVGAIMVSCKKENLKELTSSSVVTNSNKSIKLNNSPQNINGILTFTSEEHLQQYYQTLDEMVDAGHDEDKDVDALLKEVEDGLNFLSYRQDFINKYDWEDKEFTAEEIDEMYKKDFIIDEVRKSILNEYLEVGIGDYIYVYFSENQVYKIPNSKFDVVTSIRDMEKGDDDIVLSDVLRPEIELVSSKIISASKYVKEYGDIPLKTDFYEHHHTTSGYNNINCDIYNKKIWGSLRRDYYDTIDSINVVGASYVANSIVVEFGDGSSETFTGISDFTATHTYPSTGTYSVRITFDYTDSDNNTETSEEEFSLIVNGACSENNKAVPSSRSNSSWKLTSKGWVKKDVFGKHLASYSHSWKWNSNKSKWKRAKHDLFCRVEGAFRDDNCNVVENLAKSKTTYGKKLTSKKHRVFKNYDINSDDCLSSHSFGGSTFYHQNLINPCE